MSLFGSIYNKNKLKNKNALSYEFFPVGHVAEGSIALYCLRSEQGRIQGFTVRGIGFFLLVII